METEYINEKLIYMKDLLSKLKIRLESYQNETDKEMQETYFAAMTKFAEEIIEIAIKINTKLMEENNDFASTYHKTFQNLSKYYNFNKKDLDYFARSTSLRNRATHEYTTLFENQEKSVKEYETLIKKYPKYLKYIKNIINKKS